ncbi:uncharacterized protein ALTATR162_LOCUS8556 [Alternaria atra]|uniref:Uncharacterized protein n=1 Tax=Alternaria atra TaxID=119953 RepID=A0A8J2I546_9PLEO|nr:uncharacterized protein ALTATR162_LOCUS8556 [Alternaria atra]CAG5178147.1 unnamed protein product [Alternaria atra]
MLFMKDKPIASTTREMIAVMLMMDESRQATKAEILHRASHMPYMQQALLQNGTGQEAHAKQLLEDIDAYFSKEKTQFEVMFPPEDYHELRAAPKARVQTSNKDVLSAWALKVGAEIAEEEKDREGEGRHNRDYGANVDDWCYDAEEEILDRLESGSGPVMCVHTLPPGMENVAFASFHRIQPADDTNTNIQRAGPPRDRLSALPAELKSKIARLVLVFPSKLSIAASTYNDRTWSDDLCKDDKKQMEHTTYRFAPYVKVPKFVIPPDAGSSSTEIFSYHWALEPSVVILALLAVNKLRYEIGKPIFYGENYFEVKDGGSYHFSGSNFWTRTYHFQPAHHFFELMSWSRARDGSVRYGVRPLVLMRKINIDMEFWEGENCHYSRQIPWHFDRTINTLVAIPHLNKLVINVFMSTLK